jgi:MiaB-like tRNA modifying enzyme
LKEYKKTGKKIIVAGCMASIQKERIKSVIPNSKILLPKNCHQINKLINNEKINFQDENKILYPKFYSDISAPILISEGCMFSCSYCITTLARGKLKSFPIKNIKKDIYKAINQGCREIRLTAQDTSSYGLDLGTHIGELFNKISSINRDFKIRVGMMNPYTLKKNLDSVIDGFKNPKIYKFIHIPVQSGDNEILQKMNRKYLVEDFDYIVREIRKNIPSITISTDIIVGFPGESDYHFQKTIDMLKKIRPDITNITRFSARPFTIAKKMKGRINTEIVKQRSRELTELCKEISLKINQKYIGEIYQILITKEGKNKTVVGRSENYKPVVMYDILKIGEFVNTRIIDAKLNYLVGSII